MVSSAPWPHYMVAAQLSFGSGVHSDISSQIKAPWQLSANNKGDLRQLERLHSTGRRSFSPIVELKTKTL